MFSWICPRCGRENRSSDNECKYCQAPEPEALVEATAIQPPEQIAMPAPPVQIPSAAPYQPPPPPRSAAVPVYRTPTKTGIPTWLLIPLFAFAFIGLGAAIYFGYQRVGNGKAGFTGGETPLVASGSKAKAGNPLQKYVEVVGIRLTQDTRKKPQAKFVVVNHGSAELDELTANVTLWASTSRSEEDSVGTFTFKINSLGPNDAKEISTPLKTRLKIYELPDWQNLTADVQITSP